MSDRFGLLTLPAAASPPNDPKTAIGDPTLDKLLAFLKAAINADTKKIWSVVHPAIIAPATEPLPIGFTNPHDPDDASFNSKALPALFAWRQAFPRATPLTQDWDQQISMIAVLWVPPPASFEQQRIRQPFRNAYTKALTRALARERHSAWIDPGDTEANAADYGSFLLGRLNASRIQLLDVKPFDLVVDKLGRQEPYDAILATVELTELAVPVKDDYPIVSDYRGTVTVHGLPIDAFQFQPSVLAVTPSSGPAAGGTSITIEGHQFFEDTDVGELVVTIDGAKCTDVALVDGDTITATTPAGATGARDVVVTLPSGATSAPLVGAFTYL